MFEQHFRVTPSNPPNDGILFANLEKDGRTGHMGHALVEYAPGKILAFYPNCSSEDTRWKGHSGFGWMEYKRSLDGGETWSEPIIEPHSKALFDKQIGRTMMCEKAVCTPSGRIILFYLQCDMVTNGHIWEPYFEPYYAISTDEGHTFSPLRLFSSDRGRIYDACWHDGVIYVLFYANPELPGEARTKEHPYQLFTSTDEGESFQWQCDIPFASTRHCFYGNLVFTPDEQLMVYIYEELDEHNLKYIVSPDKGKTWGNNRRAYFENRIRNPQVIRYGGCYLMHGRSGSMGKNPGHFILYCSKDGIHWDAGRYLRMATAWCGAYSNNLIVHLPDGRERLMIQTSHAYHENRTNVIMFWVDPI